MKKQTTVTTEQYPSTSATVFFLKWKANLEVFCRNIHDIHLTLESRMNRFYLNKITYMNENCP